MYAFRVDFSTPDDTEVRDVAAAAGFGTACLIAALLLVFSRLRSGLNPVRFPPVWVGLTALVVAAMAGLAAAHWDWLPVAEPFAAVTALTGLFCAIARLVTRWPRSQAVDRREVAQATVWGMFAATGMALILQLAFAVMAVFAVLGGLALVDTSLPRSLVDRLSGTGGIEDLGSGMLQTLTVALGVSAMYAIVAPLTEEFTKLLGVVFVQRNRVTTGYSGFVTGACVGLGFSVIETLGYALAAGSAWPWLLLVRAPVAFIHVTASSLAGYGWHRQRSAGGFRVVPYLIAAILVHGAWNGLTVSAMLMSASIESANDPPVATILGILLIVALLAMVLTGCIAWTIIAARKLGQEAQQPIQQLLQEPRQSLELPGIRLDRSEVRGITT
ncbi:MAG: PrsW family intramembrane metalloprotease [Thermomicrobiales bacterium]|nr:PrsW family intramembrane metalloprotease [Thermomicrobiales bacterium]